MWIPATTTTSAEVAKVMTAVATDETDAAGAALVVSPALAVAKSEVVMDMAMAGAAVQ